MYSDRCRIVEATTRQHFLQGVKLFREYAASLNFDLGYQGFEKELLEVEKQYGPPDGALLLVEHHDHFIGCVAVRRLTDTIGEVKRMYLEPSARGKGLGAEMLKEIMQIAIRLGYEKLRLDTKATMHSAIKLYTAAGFNPIAAYTFHPSDDVLYFECDLNEGRS